MSTLPPLDEQDVRAMVRLLGQVAANSGDHAAKKQQLMDGLGRMIAADYWAWVLCAEMKPGAQPVYLFQSALTGGFQPDQFARYIKAVDHPDMSGLTKPLAIEVAQRRSQVTRLIQHLDPAGTIRTLAVGTLWREAGIFGIMVSIHPIGAESASGIGIYRRLGQPLFTRREARIAHILLSEVPWLHAAGWPDDRGVTIPHLARQARSVLNLLLSGLSRKQIATGLKLSEHTVNGYVKAVYRHFGMHSQAALINRFLRGDGGDSP